MTTAVVLAAGEGRRFGGAKQLALVRGRPLLSHAVAAARAAGLDRVVVVLGARAEAVRAGVDLGGVDVAVCEDWADGLSASLRCGLRAAAASDEVDEVVILLGDQPGVGPEAVTRVRAAPGDAARATYGGAPGHPVVLRRALLARAGELTGDTGFRDLLDGATLVECGDLGDPRDIDTPEDLDAAPALTAEEAAASAGAADVVEAAPAPAQPPPPAAAPPVRWERIRGVFRRRR